MIKNRNTREQEDAVSPVVGVMLMLVVTIIIAAVVSGFAGGLVGGSNTKTPTLAMDVKISTTGASQGFSATVTGVSQPILTKDIRIVTSWSKLTSSGYYQTGGNTTMAGSKIMAPWGFGPGVSGPQNLQNEFTNMNATFGNYTLVAGTGLATSSTNDITSVLGPGWQNLSSGDKVTVNIVHIPTGRVIFGTDVAVTEG
jgi:archaeal type IV pilus assembly protein PilA